LREKFVTVPAPRLALLFLARTRLCALPLTHVLESMRPLPVTALAAMPDFVLGAALVRGVPTVVLDAGRLTGARDAGAPTRLVLLRTAKGRAALAVEAVLGPREIPPDMQAQLPPLLRDAAVIGELARLDGELLLVLEPARLLAEVPDALLAEAPA
jgi:purine-binding chemotaxis protein CheW